MSVGYRVLINSDLLGSICDYHDDSKTDPLQNISLHVLIQSIAAKRKCVSRRLDVIDSDTKLFKLLKTAAKVGDIATVKLLAEWDKVHRSPYEWQAVFNNAIGYGHLLLVKWLYDRCYTLGSYTVSAIDKAAANGHLYVLKWLDEKRTEPGIFESNNAFDWAAANGHLHVIEWLHAKSRERHIFASRYAMDNAAANGHLDVVKWLHKNRKEGCSDNVIISAAGNGHVGVVKWLSENILGAEIRNIVSGAIPTNSLDIIKLICKHMPEGQIDAYTKENLIEYILRSNSIEVFKWVENKKRFADLKFKRLIRISEFYGDLCDPLVLEWLDARGVNVSKKDLLILAAKRGYLDVVEWLYTRYYSDLKVNEIEALEYAAREGYLPIVQLIYSNCTTPINIWKVMCSAARGGHIHVLAWLREISNQDCHASVIEEAAENGHLSVLKWLYDNYPNLRAGITTSNAICKACHASVIEEAAENGHLSVLKWLYDNYPNLRAGITTSNAICKACLRSHLHVVKWLYYNKLYTNSLNLNHYCRAKDLEMLKWLCGKSLITMDSVVRNYIVNAVGYGSLYTLKWLCASGYTDPKYYNIRLIDDAAIEGHLAVIHWLHENYGKKCQNLASAAAIDWAAEYDHIETIMWLAKNRTEGCTLKSVWRAVLMGHNTVAIWLCVNRKEISLSDALQYAIEYGNRAVQEFIENTYIIKFNPS